MYLSIISGVHCPFNLDSSLVHNFTLKIVLNSLNSYIFELSSASTLHAAFHYVLSFIIHSHYKSEYCVT